MFSGYRQYEVAFLITKLDTMLLRMQIKIHRKKSGHGCFVFITLMPNITFSTNSNLFSFQKLTYFFGIILETFWGTGIRELSINPKQ